MNQSLRIFVFNWNNLFFSLYTSVKSFFFFFPLSPFFRCQNCYQSFLEDTYVDGLLFSLVFYGSFSLSLSLYLYFSLFFCIPLSNRPSEKSIDVTFSRRGVTDSRQNDWRRWCVIIKRTKSTPKNCHPNSIQRQYYIRIHQKLKAYLFTYKEKKKKANSWMINSVVIFKVLNWWDIYLLEKNFSKLWRDIWFTLYYITR